MDSDNENLMANQGDARAKPRDLRHLYRGPFGPVAPTARELGERLKWLRKEVGRTANEVARQCGVDEADVVAFECDGTGSAETLVALVTKFSWFWQLDKAFTAPRLPSVDEMVEFERRQRDGKQPVRLRCTAHEQLRPGGRDIVNGVPTVDPKWLDRDVDEVPDDILAACGLRRESDLSRDEAETLRLWREAFERDPPE